MCLGPHTASWLVGVRHHRTLIAHTIQPSAPSYPTLIRERTHIMPFTTAWAIESLRKTETFFAKSDVGGGLPKVVDHEPTPCPIDAVATTRVPIR